MKEVKSKLETLKAELLKEAEKLTAERKTLNEQGQKINRRLSEIKARELQMQGEYKVLQDLEKDEKPEKK